MSVFEKEDLKRLCNLLLIFSVNTTTDPYKNKEARWIVSEDERKAIEKTLAALEDCLSQDTLYVP